MVRKFISSRSDGIDSLNSERERRVSSIRRQCSDQEDDASVITSVRSSMSRENSVARSVGRSEVTSPTPSNVSDSVSSSRETGTRSYMRSYSSRMLDSSSGHSTPTPHNADGYSSGSLGRRGLFSSKSDHMSSLPRRANRFAFSTSLINRRSNSDCSKTNQK